jgi:hypothetical protein
MLLEQFITSLWKFFSVKILKLSFVSFCELQTGITVSHILILFSTFIRYYLNISMVPGTTSTWHFSKDVKQCCRLCSFGTCISHTFRQGFLQHWLLSALHQTIKFTALLAWHMSTALTSQVLIPLTFLKITYMLYIPSTKCSSTWSSAITENCKCYWQN